MRQNFDWTSLGHRIYPQPGLQGQETVTNSSITTTEWEGVAIQRKSVDLSLQERENDLGEANKKSQAMSTHTVFK